MTSTRSEVRRQTMEHVYETIGLNDWEYSEAIMTITDVRVWGRMSDERFNEMISNDELTMMQVICLEGLRHWLNNYRNSIGPLPTTIEEWRVQFTEDSFDILGRHIKQEAEDVQVKHEPIEAKQESEEPEDTHYDMRIRLSDYPEFDGRHDKWYTIKEEFEALLESQNLSDVMDIKDIEEHQEKRKNDAVYDKKTTTLFMILKKKCSKGTALSKIKKYQDTRDGALAWKYLKEYYDQEGNKDIFGANALVSLLNLHLEYNSPGGFDKYTNDFELLCAKIAESDTPLTEQQKKTMFLRGINDRDFTATKDICQEGKTYSETVLCLRNKAIELKKASGPTPRRFRRGNNTRQGGRGGRDGRGRGRSGRGRGRQGQQDRNNGRYLPPEVWEKMSKANRDYWIALRDKDQSNSDGSNTEYGNQYSGKGDQSNQRRMNQTSKEEHETQDETPGDTKDPNNDDDGGGIWKPVSRKGKMMRRQGQATFHGRYQVSSHSPENGTITMCRLTGFENTHQDYSHGLPIYEYSTFPIEQARELFPDAVVSYWTCNSWARDDPSLHWVAYYILEKYPMNEKYFWVYDFLDQHNLEQPPRNTTNVQDAKVNVTKARISKIQNVQLEDNEMNYEMAYIDSGCDTVTFGGNAWIPEELTNRTVTITGYNTTTTVSPNVKIGTAITATDLPDGTTILIRVHEGTFLDKNSNSLLSLVQMREHQVEVDDVPRRYGGLSTISVDGYVIPLVLHEAMVALKIRKPTKSELENCDIVELTSPDQWNPEELTESDVTNEEYNDIIKAVEDARHINPTKTSKNEKDWKHCEKFLFYPGHETTKMTIRNTTQYGKINLRIPMRQHLKSRNPLLQRRRIKEPYATDTWFSTVTSYEGYNCCQIFHGIKSKHTSHYGMLSESNGPEALLDFFRQEGVPISMTRDNSRMQTGKLWNEYCRKYWVKDDFIEPGHSHQNPAERAMSWQKEKLDRVFQDTGCDPRAWYRAACHVADVTNHTAYKKLSWRTPIEVRDGQTPDITGLLQHEFWDWVYYTDPETQFPSKGGKEKLGRWLGRAHNYGDEMCYYILTDETEEIITRSMVRSARETTRPNRAFETEENEDNKASGESPIISYVGLTAEKDKEQASTRTSHQSGDLPGSPKIITDTTLQFEPDDLIDLFVKDKFTTRTGREYTRSGKVKEHIGSDVYRVQFDNGSQRVYEYEEIIGMVNRDDEEGVERWTYESIQGHRWSTDPERKGKLDVYVKWAGYDTPTWEPMEVIKKDDPVTLAMYAKENELLDQVRWKWAKRYTRRSKLFTRMYRNVMASKRKKCGIKYKFGVRIPRTLKEAYELDKLNGNTYWEDAIKREVGLLVDEYSTFRKTTDDDNLKEYQCIKLIWVFDVKFDGRRRARLVAGGHTTTALEYDMYSGMVDLESVRIAFVAAALYDLKVIAADVASAYLQAYTFEKIYFYADEAFGQLKNRPLIIVKALYGLRASGFMWHQKCADSLRNMGFTPTKSDFDLWIRDKTEYYEYVAVITDDLLVFSKEPNDVLGPLQEVCGYTLKGIGIPEYYSGGDIWKENNGKYWALGAKTYIRNVCERIERLLEIKLKNYGSPMASGDHPEQDDTDILFGADVSIYQMLIGSAQWAVTLGRFDIQYATNTLARFASCPRRGHFQRALRIFGYLKYYPKVRLLFDPSSLNFDGLKFENHDWYDLYPDAKEDVPKEAPVPKGNDNLHITVMVDADHASDTVTRRSVTGYLILLGKSIVKWYSKRQNTVESSTYGSELVALRIAVEGLLEIRYKLRMMGINFDETSTILCNNMSVVVNMQFPSTSIKKKHNSVAFHRVREVISCAIARIAHYPGYWNLSDILTKPKGPHDHYRLIKYPLLGQPESCQGESQEKVKSVRGFAEKDDRLKSSS